jgi:hypothetical protein
VHTVEEASEAERQHFGWRLMCTSGSVGLVVKVRSGVVLEADSWCCVAAYQEDVGGASGAELTLSKEAT